MIDFYCPGLLFKLSTFNFKLSTFNFKLNTVEDQSEYKKFEPLRQGKTKAQYENTMKILIWITAIYGVGFIAWMIYEISKYIFFITTPVQL